MPVQVKLKKKYMPQGNASTHSYRTRTGGDGRKRSHKKEWGKNAHNKPKGNFTPHRYKFEGFRMIRVKGD